MRKLIIALIVISAICFAQSSEQCFPSVPEIPANSCFNEGYVCSLTTESSGGVRFALGRNSVCDSMETTNFFTYRRNSEGNLDTTKHYILMPFLQEGPEDNVGALAVAMNTAFLINASNEKFKVRVTYHRVGNVLDENSVRLLAVSKALNATTP